MCFWSTRTLVNIPIFGQLVLLSNFGLSHIKLSNFAGGGGEGGGGGGGGGRESFCITPDNRNIQINVFPISPQKYMLWVLIRMGFTEATLMNIHNVYFHGKLSS